MHTCTEFIHFENDNDHLIDVKRSQLVLNKIKNMIENLISEMRDNYYTMKPNKNPSILYCCNGLNNFSILMVEKLLCELDCEINNILTYGRRSDSYD